MDAMIRPYTWLALRLPTGTHKVLQVVPNTSSTINIGKYGLFEANQILGRPLFLTFEIISTDKGKSTLRIVPAAELHEDALREEHSDEAQEEAGTPSSASDGVEFDVVDAEGRVLMKANRNVANDSSQQRLSVEEIETLRRQSTGSGREIIARILESRSGRDQKTAFAMAKYTLRKTKKYLRRFTVLPLDVNLLAHWMLHEKDAPKIMEMREEVMALVVSWSNVRFGEFSTAKPIFGQGAASGGSKWLTVDDTGGLVVAMLAERMGILYPREKASSSKLTTNGISGGSSNLLADRSPASSDGPGGQEWLPALATANTLTLLHSGTQPNLSLLSYFSYDAVNPDPSHPLTAHLRTVSWLQLLRPDLDNACREPPIVPDGQLETYKSGKRGVYFRKRRRWQRMKELLDDVHAGGFDGLVVASAMDAQTIMRHAVPLLRGGAQLVVYSANIEPLVELADAYSSARKTAFMNLQPSTAVEAESSVGAPTDDFPVDPTLVLAPTIHAVRARPWQVLPGRTHPVMTDRGGADGFVFTGTRILRGERKVEGRGNYAKRRRDGHDDE